MRIASFLAVFLAGCSPKLPDPPPVPTMPTHAATPAVSPPTPPATMLGDEDCTRGDAIAVLDPARVSAHTFRRGMGPRAEESATLADGVTVRIQHLGCAHFVERFTFFVPGGAGPATDLTPWLVRLSALLKALPVREGRIKPMAKWAELLATRAAATPAYAAGEEIVVIPRFDGLFVTVTPVAGGMEIELVDDIAL